MLYLMKQAVQAGCDLCRLHWRIWDHWWSQSRENCCQSHREAEQGKCGLINLHYMVTKKSLELHH